MDVLRHWTAEGKTDEQLAPRHIDGEWYLHVSDCHHALAERDAALRQLAGAVKALRQIAEGSYAGPHESARTVAHGALEAMGARFTTNRGQ